MKKKPKKLYLSTHGDGVSWLHFRLGHTPKYYVHNVNIKWGAAKYEMLFETYT